ncbi:MAG: hypothetical protein KDM63_10815, partial [Verrucomicrobiae bacterium]|nr:hypothetical protein [Verrucomicrobiae bacterium]
ARTQAEAGGDLFDLIQRNSSVTIKDPGKTSFEQVFDVPEFVRNLPYRSRILGMERGQWESMSESEKLTYLNDWRGMSNFYGVLLQEPSLGTGGGVWRRLSENGDEYVMIPLDKLP